MTDFSDINGLANIACLKFAGATNGIGVSATAAAADGVNVACFSLTALSLNTAVFSSANTDTGTNSATLTALMVALHHAGIIRVASNGAA